MELELRFVLLAINVPFFMCVCLSPTFMLLFYAEVL